MKFCYGCMSPIEDDMEVCPYCGYHDGQFVTAGALMPGTLLQEKYLLGRVLGAGGFGITYIAFDLNLQTKIAIKEFFPSNMVQRDVQNTDSLVLTLSEVALQDYQQGLERYVKEAGILSRFFKLPGIVSVKDFFYANQTAYMVMEFVEGISLKEYLKSRGGRITPEEMLVIMKPVLESLRTVHSANVIHRDISPDNIMVNANGNITLIDFGAAVFSSRQGRGAIIVKPGYAPKEQYEGDVGRQGPWTDVYGLCATMYRMLSGEAPAAYDKRNANGKLKSLRKFDNKIPRYINKAILKGLAVEPEDRLQNVSELYGLLYAKDKKAENFKTAKTAAIAVTAACAFFGLVWIFWSIMNNKTEETGGSSAKQEENIETGQEKAEGDAEEAEEGLETDENLSGEEQEAEEGQASDGKQVLGQLQISVQEVNIRNSNNTSADIMWVAKKGENYDYYDTIEGNGGYLWYCIRQEDGKEGYVREDMVTMLEESGNAVVKQEETKAVSESSDSGSSLPASAGSAYAMTQDEEYACMIVREGTFNSRGNDTPVGEMLDGYYDMPGQWSAVLEDGNGNGKVYYSSSKGGISYTIIFQVYSNDTFNIIGVEEDGQSMARYNEYVSQILASMGY